MNRLLILIAAIFSFFAASAQEALFKSVYIYNFGSLIEWPAADRTGDFVIGVYGSSPVQAELAKVAAQKKMGTATIQVKSLSSASGANGCHIVFIAPDKIGELGAIAQQLKGKSTLVIGDKEGAAKQGAAISFVAVEGKIKFELNKSNCAGSNLKVSQNLEKLAIIVN